MQFRVFSLYCVFIHVITESKLFAVDGLESKTCQGKKGESSFLHLKTLKTPKQRHPFTLIHNG